MGYAAFIIGFRAQVVLLVLGLAVVTGCAAEQGPSPDPTPTVTPTEAPTAGPTVRPTFLLLPAEGRSISPSTYTLRSAGYRFTLTVPEEGWRSLDVDWGLFHGSSDSDPPNFGALALWGNPMFVYLDPCHWTGTERSTGTSPDDWITAIAEVKELRPSALTDVLVGGYRGKRIRITVADDVEASACVEGEYRAYEGRTHLVATQSDDLWIVGLPDGDRQVIVMTSFPGTPDDVLDQMEQMMASMTIEPA